MKSKRSLLESVDHIEQFSLVRAVRGGLINMIPVLIIGAFALIFNSFPVDAYQSFIKTFAGGLLSEFFTFLNSATFGVLSVYMTYSISRSYMKINGGPEAVNGGAVFASFIGFFIMTGVYLDGFNTANMGPKAMFVAIIAGLFGSAIYLRFQKLFSRRKHLLFSAGADREFNRMLSAFFPVVLTGLIFATVNLIVIRVFDTESFHRLYIDKFNELFSHGETGFFKGLAFVFLSSLLWFFGIHGSDALQGVMDNIFMGQTDAAAAVANGQEVAPILRKEFFDCFVLMGGCGSAICLLIALLIFSRNKARRGLSYTAALPMMFNINELMVFGFPVILNPLMLIPFLLTPIVCYSSAYLATSIGLVPEISNAVEWTTPVILGGFKATGSAAGSLLQVFNIILGVAIYTPFVRLSDRVSDSTMKQNYEHFLDYFKKNENNLQSVRLSDLNNLYGDIAKNLSADLRFGITNGLTMYYQPQYNYNGKCDGVEALLRWDHPKLGIIYPPLVVKLAKDSGLLPTLEQTVLTMSLADRAALLMKYGEDIKLSINVTGATASTQQFISFIRTLNDEDPFKGKNICLEITEQTALELNDATRDAMNELREMGILLAIDDFSMGQTSLHYLKDNLFDIVKIDGSLVRGLLTNANCREIISSIIELSDTLRLTVIAEFVEKEEQKEILHQIGCDVYQGYLYSPAVPLYEDKDK